ncbi:MAG: hypothetical protein ACREDY_27095, partial [Bradyrhizobium sp.]
IFLRPVGLPPHDLYAVPGSAAPLTGQGKVSIPALKRIVGQLSAVPAGAGGFGAIRNRRTGRKLQYFYLTEPRFGLPAGIFGLRGREVLPIIIFVRRPAYRKRFDFYGVAERSARRNFPEQFHIALANALATAR